MRGCPGVELSWQCNQSDCRKVGTVEEAFGIVSNR